MRYAEARTRADRHAFSELLESRKFFSGDFPAGWYASANAAYFLKLDSETAAVESIKWAMARTVTATGLGALTPGDFTITLPDGPISQTLMARALSQQSIPTLTLQNSFESDNQVLWQLENVVITRFSEKTNASGQLTDQVSFGLARVGPNRTGGTLTQSFFLPNGAKVSWGYDFGRSNSSGAPTFANTDAFATDPAVTQTVEFGHGQLPVNDFSAGVDATGSSAAFSSAMFSSVDGAATATIAADVSNGKSFPQIIFTQRGANGLATTRWVHASARFYSYSVYDSVLDSKPRMTSISYYAPRAQQLWYRYDAQTGHLTSTLSAGRDTAANLPYNPATLTATVLPPTSGLTADVVNSIDIQFSDPVATFPLEALRLEGFAAEGLTLTPSSDLKTWTLGNLAPQQSADGRYAVKLLAIDSGIASTAGASLIGSAGRSWVLDRAPPAVASSGFAYDLGWGASAASSLYFNFSEAISSSAGGVVPIEIRLANSNTLVKTLNATILDDLSVVGYLDHPLPDGRYEATIAAGSIIDAAGKPLGAAARIPFFVLAGDANHDATVDFTDLVILAQNYNKTGLGFADGNFDYSADGTVDFSDLVILAQHYNTSLAPLTLLVRPGATPAPLRKRGATMIDL